MERKDINIEELKKKLEAEFILLIEELKTVGKINPDNPEDWVAKPSNMDTSVSDLNETADGYEAYEENAGILNELEIRFNEVKSAIKRIKEKSYGQCQTCKRDIEKDRLEANPSSTTCKEHMNQ